MAPHKEIFSLSGPTHLTAIDWENLHHRRSIAASLVQGVSVLERDRQVNRQGPKALAPPWWSFAHFQLTGMLIDDVDNSIFGAIYQLSPSAFNYTSSPQHAPKYVVAFRGTKIKWKSFVQDVKLDLQCFTSDLNHSPRFNIAMQYVLNTVLEAGAMKVWLTGHSLGSAIALLIGKEMTKMGFPIESYLFNPLFLSAPTERIKNEKVKHGIRIARSVVKAGLAVSISSLQRTPKLDDPFIVLSNWTPHLFVNPCDYICSEYIGYFTHRQKMEQIGFGKIESVATRTSFRSILCSIAGIDKEQLHLIPSAYLHSNQDGKFRRPHRIHQWWDPNISVQSDLHQLG